VATVHPFSLNHLLADSYDSLTNQIVPEQLGEEVGYFAGQADFDYLHFKILLLYEICYLKRD
jgi:hypothetical protein